MFKECVACRSCGGTTFVDILSLGNQYVIDFVKERDENALRAPLDVVMCNDCHLVQLKHSVNPDHMYKRYWYRSGISEVMRAALRDIVNMASVTADLRSGASVLDIGCNDGTLLSMMPDGVKRVGVDPCRDLVKEGVDARRIDAGVVGYFSADSPVKQFAPYKVITAIAMFYDLNNPRKFLDDCKKVLAKDGVLIIQMNYLMTMLRERTLDNISHEHVAYYSLAALKRLIEAADLEIVGSSVNNVNGGSVRVYATHAGGDISSYRIPTADRVALHMNTLNLLKDEAIAGLDSPAVYKTFAKDIAHIKEVLRKYILAAKASGEKLYLYGASTRGATLLQYLDLPEGTFIAAAERDVHKFGLMTVGTWVPIKAEVECRSDASVFLLLPYFYWEGIRRREYKWIENGGTFIIPLPQPQTVTALETVSLLTGSAIEA